MIAGYVVRHGETEANAKKITQGAADFPLTLDGELQAKKLGEKLSGLGILKIIASNMGRAQKTAKIINSSLNVRLYTNDLIREISCGKYDGKPEKDLEVENPGYKSLTYQFPEGESPIMVLKRISQFFNNFEENYTNEPFLLVCHSGTIKAMMIIAKALPESEFYFRKIPHDGVGKITIKNGKISSFEFI